MANNKALRRTFELIDKASRPLKGIQRGFRAMGQSGTRAMQSLRRAQRRLNLDRLAGSVMAVGRAARTTLAPVGRLAGSLAALAGIGGIGSLASIVTGFGREGDSIAKAADRLGLAIEQYQELRYAATRGGFEQGFDQSVRTLNQRIGDAKNGNKELAQLFRQLNIPLEDANGNLRTAGDILPDIAEAFRLNENAVTRTAIATKLFEAEGVGMINVLKGGREELARLRAEARENGLLTEEQARLAEQQQDAIFNLSAAWNGLTNAIGGELSPVLLPLIRSMRNWVNANREWLSSEITGSVTALVARLKEIDWVGLARGARDFFRSVNDLVTGTVGWKIALAGLAVVLASGVILNVVTLTLALGKLGVLLTATAVKLGLLVFGPVVAALGNLIVALRAGYGAMAAFNLVLTANPIGVLIVGIGALIAALAALVIYWDEIAAAAKRAWGVIVDAAELAWTKVKPIIEAMQKGLAALSNFNPVQLVSQGASALFSQFGDEEGGAAADPRRVRGGSLVARNAQNNASRVDVSGKTDVNVRFDNTPPGTRVKSSSEGRASSNLEVGYGLLAQP